MFRAAHALGRTMPLKKCKSRWASIVTIASPKEKVVKLYVPEYGVRGKAEHRVITICEAILLAISLMLTNSKYLVKSLSL
jgi:hypothetical protein